VREDAADWKSRRWCVRARGKGLAPFPAKLICCVTVAGIERLPLLGRSIQIALVVQVAEPLLQPDGVTADESADEVGREVPVAPEQSEDLYVSWTRPKVLAGRLPTKAGTPLTAVR
jgi:hypothetical protein